MLTIMILYKEYLLNGNSLTRFNDPLTETVFDLVIVYSKIKNLYIICIICKYFYTNLFHFMSTDIVYLTAKGSHIMHASH